MLWEGITAPTKKLDLFALSEVEQRLSVTLENLCKKFRIRWGTHGERTTLVIVDMYTISQELSKKN